MRAKNWPVEELSFHTGRPLAQTMGVLPAYDAVEQQPELCGRIGFKRYFPTGLVFTNELRKCEKGLSLQIFCNREMPVEAEHPAYVRLEQNEKAGQRGSLTVLSG
jgi:hypothetical protein